MSCNISILISDSWGVYIPLHFVTSFNVSDWNIDSNCWEVSEILKGPEAEHYLDAWQTLCDTAKHLDNNGIEWSLHQNGDLWAVAWGNMTEEEKEDFVNC